MATTLLSFTGGPWHGERRRFTIPPAPTIFVTAGGEYRLDTGYTGPTYRWYPDRSEPPQVAGG